jgi:hypothetical protein
MKIICLHHEVVAPWQRARLVRHSARRVASQTWRIAPRKLGSLPGCTSAPAPPALPAG